jgi:hypothetical protein
VTAISDLHSVREDSDEDTPESFVTTKQEYIDYVYEQVEYDLIVNEIHSHIAKVDLVKRTLLAWIHRRRAQKMEENSVMIQRHLRGFICWKNVRQELRQARELRWLQMIQLRIRKADETERDRMDQAAKKIQRTIYQAKIKQKRQGKEIREQLAKLPYICRNGFIKMMILKANTNSLQNEVKFTLRY